MSCPCGECQRVVQLILDLEKKLCPSSRSGLMQRWRKARKNKRKVYLRKRDAARYIESKRQALQGVR